MRKDKEWLKEELKSDECELEYVFLNFDTDEKVLLANDVYKLIDQLDDYTIEQPKLLTVIVKDYDKTIKTIKLSEDKVNKMMEGLE